MLNSIKKIIFLCLISLLLITTGCGYHLRGSGPAADLELSSVYLDSINTPLVINGLRKQLATSGATISQSAAAADRTLRLRNETYKRRVLSVDETTGKVTEFELEYQVDLLVLNNKEEALAKSQTIAIIRDVTFDAEAALGKFDEETIVKEDMIRNAANTILLRAQALQ